jgi:hypothetical protein
MSKNIRDLTVLVILPLLFVTSCSKAGNVTQEVHRAGYEYGKSLKNLSKYADSVKSLFNKRSHVNENVQDAISKLKTVCIKGWSIFKVTSQVKEADAHMKEFLVGCEAGGKK